MVIDETQKDLEAFGLVAENAPETTETVCEVFKENWQTVTMFIRMATQWRSSMAGLSGLDYSVLFQLFDLYDIKERKDVFEGVQVMETAVLLKLSAEK